VFYFTILPHTGYYLHTAESTSVRGITLRPRGVCRVGIAPSTVLAIIQNWPQLTYLHVSKVRVLIALSLYIDCNHKITIIVSAANEDKVRRNGDSYIDTTTNTDS